ncbi:MAG: phosphatidylglycerophosphatase A [Planctomycetes bacterium]|nr:phosphatidylglycerophosphatase A [Planctomycetota bacterium]
MKRLVGSFLYVGMFPFAPGTLASLIAAVLVGASYACSAPLWPWAAAAAVLFFAGVWAGSSAMRDFGQKDPKAFVLDEAVGQIVACLGAHAAVAAVWNLWINVAAAFVLFRFFDILKPPPIRQAERLPAGWGIMADDLIAGLVSAAIIAAVNLACR